MDISRRGFLGGVLGSAAALPLVKFLSDGKSVVPTDEPHEIEVVKAFPHRRVMPGEIQYCGDVYAPHPQGFSFQADRLLSELDDWHVREIAGVESRVRLECGAIPLTPPTFTALRDSLSPFLRV